MTREQLDRLLAYLEYTSLPAYLRLRDGHEIDIVTGKIVA